VATIPDQTIERIREQADIVDVIGGHVGLKRSGKQFKGLCPFHDERSPSFYVDPVRRSFKCFGCGVWGDVFDFIQKVEGVGFLASIRTMGARVGVALPNQSEGDVRRAEVRERERELAYRVNAAAAECYRTLLLEGEHGEAGRRYHAERGIDDATGETFQIGYAPAPEEAGWDTLVHELQRRELPLETAEQLGLVARSKRGGYYDRFRGRLMFPIVQPGGRVLGFSGRVLPAFAQTDDGEKAPKYVNSPESVLYKKSKTLFGLHIAGSAMRQRDRGILVEGQVDVIAMHQLGFIETVAPLGTALTKQQCELLGRFSKQIVLCFDGDQAGAKAAYAAMPLLLEGGVDVRVAALPAGEDPDSCDPQVLENLLRAPSSGLEWLMKRMVAKGARQSIDAQARALRALIPLLRCVRGRDARGDYCNLAADMLGLPARRVWSAVGGDLPVAPDPRSRDKNKSRDGWKGSKSGSKSGKNKSWSKGQSHGGNRFAGSGRASGGPAQGYGFPPEPEFSGGPQGGPPESTWTEMGDSGSGPGLSSSGFDDGPSFVGPPPERDEGNAPGPPERGGGRGPVRSQFSGGMPHSAAMRPVQPLPSGQASVTALLVDRPELARVAEREGVLDRVTDTRLHPILARVIRAALEGEAMPSEGELLELVEQSQHRLLHDSVFGHEYLEDEDPQAALDHGLILCKRDDLEREVRQLDQGIAEARTRGDLEALHELMRLRMAAVQSRHDLRADLQRK